MKSGTLHPFIFMTSIEAVQLTGVKVASLADLEEGMRQVDDSSIYYHTHRFYRTHSFLGSADRSDFALWISNNLKEDLVAEKMGSLDLRDFHTIHDLREALLKSMEPLKSEPVRWNRKVPPGLEFYFCRATSLIMPTGHEVHNLEEFIHALERIDTSSIYYHLIEAPLHQVEMRKDFRNDFSQWLSEVLNMPTQSMAVATLDPYRSDLESLRRDLLAIFGKNRFKAVIHQALNRLNRDPSGEAASNWLKNWRKSN